MRRVSSSPARPWWREAVELSLVAGLFAALAVAWTWPLAADLGRQVRDTGDPLLNTWILQWNLRVWRLGSWSSYFDTNIFHPATRTLAYSEHLFTEGLLALLLRPITRNPIALHNLVLLAGPIGSGLGMYLLARHLTGDRRAALVAAQLFTFSPWAVSQLSHLQSLWTGGLPLALLFLERLLAGGRHRDVAGLVVVGVLQALANGHYALYLALFVALRVAWHGSEGKPARPWRLAAQLAVGAVLAAALTAPFFAQYWELRQDAGFERRVEYFGSAAGLFATLPGNWLWGDRLARSLPHAEAILYPGLATILLAGAGWWALGRRSVPTEDPAAAPGPPAALHRWAPGALLGVAVLLLLLGGAGASERATSRLVSSLLAGAVVVALVGRRGVGRDAGERGRDGAASTLRLSDAPLETENAPARRRAKFYGLLAVVSFLCLFGPYGPYRLLAKLPGFDGLRVATRLEVGLLLGLAVLAAYGLRHLLESGGSRRRALAVAASVVAAAEALHVPIGLVEVPLARDLDRAYVWLAQQPRGTVVVELPLARRVEEIALIEPPRVYASAFHWRRLVNGYSGHVSPLYTELLATWWRVPVGDTVTLLQGVGTRYVFLHLDELDAQQTARWRAGLAALPERARLVRKLERTLVYELASSAGGWRDGFSDGAAR